MVCEFLAVWHVLRMIQLPAGNVLCLLLLLRGGYVGSSRHEDGKNKNVPKYLRTCFVNLAPVCPRLMIFRLRGFSVLTGFW